MGKEGKHEEAKAMNWQTLAAGAIREVDRALVFIHTDEYGQTVKQIWKSPYNKITDAGMSVEDLETWLSRR